MYTLITFKKLSKIFVFVFDRKQKDDENFISVAVSAFDPSFLKKKNTEKLKYEKIKLKY